MIRLAAVVVLYYPDEKVVENILTYLPEVDSLLVVDNSPPGKANIVDHIPAVYHDKVEYLPNSRNEGMAVALNQGAAAALRRGSQWLLTMDQDSSFAPDALSKMIEFVKNANKNKVAIVTPFHHTPGGKLPKESTATTDVRLTMTSGNLVSLTAYQRCGPFDESLFIDSVDHEYCLRVRQNAYTIVRLNDAILRHNLGEIFFKRFLFFKVKTTNHSATRRYYMTRNRLRVMAKYFWFDLKYVRRESRHLVTDFLKVLFFESGRREKLSKMILGSYDFMTGRSGKA